MKEENIKQIPSYPLCILPQAGYIKQIDGNVLCSKTNGLIIQRRCADHIKDNALQPEIFGNNLAEMSVNLLGGCFLPEHVKFTPKGVVDFIVKTDFDGIYEYCQDAQGIYLSIPDIHNAEFPSRRKFLNQGEFDKVKDAIADDTVNVEDSEINDKKRLVAAFQKFSKDTEYSVKYRIQVVHRPTNANYWHCQIEIAPACSGGKTVSKDKAEWQKEALRTLTNFLIIYVSFDYPFPLPKVKEEWYINKSA